MNIKRVVSLGLVCALLVALVGCGEREEKDHVFAVDNHQLMRGDKTWELKTIEAPGIAKPGTPYAQIATALHRVAEVGAVNVGLELAGFSPDGATLSKEGVQAFAAVIHEATERHMGSTCRIYPATATPSFKSAAVKAAAKALIDRPEAVYIIDGEGAKALAEEFLKMAPNLVVAAPEGGQIKIVPADSKPDPGQGPLLVLGNLPTDLTAFPHFVLPDKPETYPQLDAALADPIESKPWTPDNSVLSPEEQAEGWISLFDGKTLNGWTLTGKNPNGWKVSNGVVEWAEDGGGVIRSRDRYENFILRLDWRIDEGGNSGVFIRASRAARMSRIGMELQMQGDHGQPLSNSSSGSIYVQSQPMVDATKPNGEWNSYEITVNGPLLKVLLNGQLVQNLNLDQNDELKLRLKKGFIGLQDHHRHVAFRNIRIKPL